MGQTSIDIHYSRTIPSLDIDVVRTCAQKYIIHQLEDSPEHSVCEIHIVDAPTIATLNKKYRGKETATDVLSFPLWEKPSEILRGGLIHIGSVFVNADDLPRGARVNHRSVTVHACALVKHSIRHLFGKHHSI